MKTKIKLSELGTGHWFTLHDCENPKSNDLWQIEQPMDSKGEYLCSCVGWPAFKMNFPASRMVYKTK